MSLVLEYTRMSCPPHFPFHWLEAEAAEISEEGETMRSKEALFPQSPCGEKPLAIQICPPQTNINDEYVEPQKFWNLFGTTSL